MASDKGSEEVEVLVCEQVIFEDESVKASFPIFESVEDLLTCSVKRDRTLKFQIFDTKVLI